MRPRAASTSARVGAVSVAKPEHLVHDLLYSAERVELAAMHLFQKPLELGIAVHRSLQMVLRPGRRQVEDLTAQVVAAATLQQAGVLEVIPMFHDLVPELRHAFPRNGLGQDDRRLPDALL